MRADDQILQRVGTYQRQPDQDAGIPEIVLGQIVDVRIVGDECVASGDVHAHDERVRLGGLVGSDADEHLAADLEGRLPPGRRHLDAGEGPADGLDTSEAAGPCH